MLAVGKRVRGEGKNVGQAHEASVAALFSDEWRGRCLLAPPRGSPAPGGPRHLRDAQVKRQDKAATGRKACPARSHSHTAAARNPKAQNLGTDRENAGSK